MQRHSGPPGPIRVSGRWTCPRRASSRKMLTVSSPNRVNPRLNEAGTGSPLFSPAPLSGVTDQSSTVAPGIRRTACTAIRTVRARPSPEVQRASPTTGRCGFPWSRAGPARWARRSAPRPGRTGRALGPVCTQPASDHEQRQNHQQPAAPGRPRAGGCSSGQSRSATGSARGVFRAARQRTLGHGQDGQGQHHGDHGRGQEDPVQRRIRARRPGSRPRSPRRDPRAAGCSVALAMAPNTAMPSALPIDRENRLVPVTTPRRSQSTADWAAIRVGLVGEPHADAQHEAGRGDLPDRTVPGQQGEQHRTDR